MIEVFEDKNYWIIEFNNIYIYIYKQKIYKIVRDLKIIKLFHY